MNITQDFPQRVQRRAEELFRKDLLNCSESVFKALLLEAGLPCSLELLRLATPFGRGMGGAGCCCGSLIGAQMAIGLLFGRTEESGFPPDACLQLAKHLHDRFVEKNRVTCCRVLHRGLPYGTPEQFESCAARSADAAQIAAEVLLDASHNGVSLVPFLTGQSLP